MGNRKARPITDRERRAIWNTLDAFCDQHDFSALRMRAIATLCVDTTMRLSEVLALDLKQLLDEGSTTTKPRIVSSFYLQRVQAKGRATAAPKARGRKSSAKKAKPRRGYSSERMVMIPRRARDALRVYMCELRARKWVRGPWKGTPWITIKGRGEAKHEKPGKRAIQAAWATWQARAGIVDPYRFHDLRHTGITRLSENTDNVFAVAEIAGHGDVRTTQKYVHTSPERLADLSERASARP